MPRKHKNASHLATPVASAGIATQNPFSVLPDASPPTPTASNPLRTAAEALPSPDTSSAGSPPPLKKRREGSPPPVTDTPSTEPKGKLEAQIHTLAQQRAKELLATAQASEAIAAAIDIAIASLNGLAKT